MDDFAQFAIYPPSWQINIKIGQLMSLAGAFLHSNPKRKLRISLVNWKEDDQFNAEKNIQRGKSNLLEESDITFSATLA